MYAICWKSETGVKGIGAHILTEELVIAWLSYLRNKYPTMEHWGETLAGEKMSL